MYTNSFFSERSPGQIVNQQTLPENQQMREEIEALKQKIVKLESEKSSAPLSR